MARITKAAIKAACLESRSTARPVALVLPGYAVKASRLKVFIPGSREPIAPWRWMYELVCPDGETRGGQQAVNGFVDFAHRFIDEQTTAVAR